MIKDRQEYTFIGHYVAYTIQSDVIQFNSP